MKKSSRKNISNNNQKNGGDMEPTRSGSGGTEKGFRKR